MSADLPVIDTAEARTYLAALQRYAAAEAEGEPLPDDAVSMLADLIAWADTLPDGPSA